MGNKEFIEGRVRTRISTVYMEDNILRVDYDEGASINFEDALHTVEIETEMTRKMDLVPLLVDITKIKRIDSKARSYFSSEATAAYCKKVALVVDSPLSRLIGNFFVGLNKTLMPMKLFSDKASAIVWLKE